MKQFFHALKKNRLRERVIVREGDRYLPAPKETTEYRFLPKEYLDPTPTFIYGKRVAIMVFEHPFYGIVIQSQALSRAYRKQFNFLWKIAKKRNQGRR